MRSFIHMKEEGFSIAPGTRLLKASAYADWLDAEEMLGQARKRAAEIEDRAVTFFEKEKQRGYQEGLATARQKETEQLMVLSSRIIQYLDDLEHQVAGSVMLALRKILDRFEQRELLYQMVATAIKGIRDQSRLLVRVAPLQVGPLKERIEDLIAGHLELEFLEITADSHLGETDCVIETETGIIEAGLETQLELIEKALERMFARPVESQTAHVSDEMETVL